MSALLLARAARVDFADLGATVRYLRDHRLDFDTVERAAGGAYLCPAQPVSPFSFTIEEGAELAVVIEAYGEDGEDVLDLVSWRPAYPERWRTLTGLAPAVGMACAASPYTYAMDEPLRLWRTPFAWLTAGCDGAALLDPIYGVRWLLDISPPAVAAEDMDHAASLHAERQRLLTAWPILIPETTMTEAAA